jgi:hypothetical protein
MVENVLVTFIIPFPVATNHGGSMSGTHSFDRRRFVKTIAAAGAMGALAGCGDGGDGGDGGDTATATATATETETATETATATETETATETQSGGGGGDYPDDESLSDAVSAVNSTIEHLNTNEDNSLATLNEALENVESVATIDPVEASNADQAASEAERLRSEAERITGEIVDKVPREINAQAGFQYVNPDDYTEVQDLQEGANNVSSEEAANSLQTAYDLAVMVRDQLNTAANRLEDANA